MGFIGVTPPSKLKVAGSNPAGVANDFNGLGTLSSLCFHVAMLQSVPVLFQRFTILTGDSLRQGRDKGERHHRCLSEEARIKNQNSQSELEAGALRW